MLGDENIKNLLPIAQNVRALIDEIILRMTYLPEEDKSSESPHLLALFDLLASVIDEEIIVEAAVYADRGAVVLHTSIIPTISSILEQVKDPPVQDEAMESENIEEIRGTGGSVGEFDNFTNEQDAPVLDSEVEKPSPVKTAKSNSLEHGSIDIFDDLGQVDPFNTTLLDQPAGSQMSGCSRPSHMSVQESQILNSSLNVNAINMDELSESDGCTEAELPSQKIEKGLRFYEIVCNNNSDQSIYLFPRVNYCTCDFYQKNVIEERKDFTCSHVLATWLSEALGTTRIIYSTADTLKHMADFFIERTDEFH